MVLLYINTDIKHDNPLKIKQATMKRHVKKLPYQYSFQQLNILKYETILFIQQCSVRK